MPDGKRPPESRQPPASEPPPHPEPPPDVPLPWFRLHRSDRAPLYFGCSARGRFNAPGGEFGVLYLAADPFGAFIETLGQMTGINGVARSVAAACSLCRVAATRPLSLVDLTGAGLARIGVDARLCTGDHALARRWLAALWSHPSIPDGLIYRARHDPDRFSIAVFDRAADVLVVEDQWGLLDQPALLAAILDRYGFALVPG